ncbi:MAG: hypothetical protein ACXWWU_02540 [Candidatus Limnocylindria bacterium]
MRLAKILGFAGALITAALVGGTLIGSTLAVSPEDGDPLAADAGAYCDTFMDAFASELGTTREGVVAAGQAAANAAIDAAVAAGDITEERAATMRERVAEYDGEGCGLFGRGGFGPGRGGPGHGPGHGPGRAFLGAGAIDAAADAFGIEASVLLDEVREAGSLEAVATARGVSYDDVKADVLAAVQAHVDAAVADGDIEQDRADNIIERVTTWLDEGGELPRHRGFEEDDAGA